MLSGCAAPPVRVVRHQVRAYNARDLERFVGLYAGDATLHNLITGEVIGRGEAYFRERYSDRFTQSPDLHATIHHRMVYGDYVIDHEEVVRTKGEPTVQAVAIYHVAGDRIDNVWFIFDRDVEMLDAAAARIAFTRHKGAVDNRELAIYQDTFIPDAHVVSFPSGRDISRNREEIMNRVRPFLEGDTSFEWGVADQMVFGNVLISRERQRLGDGSPWTERIVIYEFADNRIQRSWVLDEN
jgi:hypothetical protein